MMKKLCLVAAACLVLGITACSAGNEYTKAALEATEAQTTTVAAETTAVDTTAATTAVETTTADTTAATTAAQSEPKELTGIIDDASMNVLVVKDDSGKTYTFSTMDADVQAGAEGLLIGDKVTVTYTGDLESQEVIPAQVVVVSIAE